MILLRSGVDNLVDCSFLPGAPPPFPPNGPPGGAPPFPPNGAARPPFPPMGGNFNGPPPQQAQNAPPAPGGEGAPSGNPPGIHPDRLRMMGGPQH